MKKSNPLKILHITTVDIGGAYKAVERLSEALNTSDKYESKILLRNKVNESNCGEVYLDNPVKTIVSKFKNAINLVSTHGEVTIDILGSDVSKHHMVQEADIIVIHWINSFLNEKSIEKIINLGKPTYIMLHDMWHFTGGCHCDGYCGGYERGCYECPHLKKGSKVTHNNLVRKTKLYRNHKVTVLAPSNYEAIEAKKSPVFADCDIRVVGNCINTDVFKPYATLKSAICIDAKRQSDGKPLVLFTAMSAGKKNRNKGFDYLLEALNILDKDEVHLLILGNVDDESLNGIKQSYSRIGYVNDENVLAQVYSMADVTVVPSLQESFSYSVCESLACGTPTVSFPVGGILDQVIHLNNGYLAKMEDATDLVNGIRWAVKNSTAISEECAGSIAKFGFVDIGAQWERILSFPH